MTLRFGGRNNAYTSEDYTIYHFDFAADEGEATMRKVLGVEADRMRNLRIDTKHEFEQEKGAVISELEMDEDNPWDIEQKTILPLLFGKQAPYGHPGHRRARARAGGHRGCDQVALRPVVSPQQRLAGGGRRL